jgi:hypothetical protein
LKSSSGTFGNNQAPVVAENVGISVKNNSEKHTKFDVSTILETHSAQFSIYYTLSWTKRAISSKRRETTRWLFSDSATMLVIFAMRRP